MLSQSISEINPLTKINFIVTKGNAMMGNSHINHCFIQEILQFFSYLCKKILAFNFLYLLKILPYIISLLLIFLL